MFNFIPITHFYLGPVKIYTWGFLQMTAFILGLWSVKREGQRQGVQLGDLYALSILVILSSLIFARMFYVLFNWSYFLQSPWQAFRIDQGGLVFYGGFLGFLLAVFFWSRKIKMPSAKFLDIITPALFLAIFAGRMGCFLINDHIGAPANLPWSLNLDGTARHPVALYLSLNGLIGFSLLRFFQEKFKRFFAKHQGSAFTFFLLYYSFTRFFLDFTRAKNIAGADLRIFSLTLSQWFSLVIFTGVCYVMIKKISQDSSKAEQSFRKG